MTIQNFDKFVDKTLVKQGREVFEKGKVSSIEELEEGLWIATVTDKDSYNYLLSRRRKSATCSERKSYFFSIKRII